MDREAKIALAEQLWAAWSSGNPSAPEPLVSAGFILHDTGFGMRLTSWPEAREFFSNALGLFPDLVMKPVSHWENDEPDLLATLWTMTGTSATTGKSFTVDGISTLRFADNKVVEEIDYYSGDAVRAASEAG